jgi:hypothetical protein
MFVMATQDCRPGPVAPSLCSGFRQRAPASPRDARGRSRPLSASTSTSLRAGSTGLGTFRRVLEMANVNSTVSLWLLALSSRATSPVGLSSPRRLSRRSCSTNCGTKVLRRPHLACARLGLPQDDISDGGWQAASWFVSGHGLSRAAKRCPKTWALAPEGASAGAKAQFLDAFDRHD